MNLDDASRQSEFSKETSPNLENSQKRGFGEAFRGVGKRAASALGNRLSEFARQAQARALATQAETLRAAGRYEESLQLLERAIELNPEDVVAHETRGQARIGLGQNALALEDFDVAIRLDPNRASLHAARGEALRQLGDYDAALEALNRAIALNSANVFAIGTRGQVFRAQGDTERALIDFQEAVRLQPATWWVQAELCKMLIDSGRAVQALESVERGLVADPASGRGWSIKASALVALNKPEEALEAYARSIEADPTAEWPFLSLIDFTRKLSRLPEALGIVDRAIEKQPQAYTAMAARGEILRLQGDYEEALKWLDRSLDVQPNYAYALGTRGQVLLAMNKPADAIEPLRKAVSLNPSLAWAVGELMDALYALGRYTEILTEFEDAPRTAAILRRKSRALMQLDRYEEALQLTNEALELNPNEATLLVDKSIALTALDDYSAALTALDHALELEPTFAWAKYLKASTLNDIGEYSVGLEVLQGVTTQDSWLHARCLGIRATCLDNLGNYAEAEAAYVAANELDPTETWFEVGVAEERFELGNTEQAKGLFGDINARLETATDVDATNLWYRGWCHYRLDNFDEAARLFGECLSLDPTQYSSAFKLALCLVRSRRLRLASGEYERALEIVKSRNPLRRRGILTAALSDLSAAVPLLADTDERAQATAVEERLTKALREAESQAQQAREPRLLSLETASASTASPPVP
jgi:tetratricopeptide (TPR) repeat protein